MVSRSQHWLHQFQLVTQNSLKGATNYDNRATGVGTKHAVLRPRPRPWPSGQNELECTRVSRPWSRDHNTGLCSDVITTEKVKVHTLDIAPLRSESPPQKRSGMARVLR